MIKDLLQTIVLFLLIFAFVILTFIPSFTKYFLYIGILLIILYYIIEGILNNIPFLKEKKDKDQEDNSI